MEHILGRTVAAPAPTDLPQRVLAADRLALIQCNQVLTLPNKFQNPVWLNAGWAFAPPAHTRCSIAKY